VLPPLESEATPANEEDASSQRLLGTRQFWKNYFPMSVQS